MMAKDAVSTAALPRPLTTLRIRQTMAKAEGVCNKVTSPKHAVEAAQTTCPMSSSVLLSISLIRNIH